MKKWLTIAIVTALMTGVPQFVHAEALENSNAVTVFDSAIYQDLFSTPAMRNVFSNRQLVKNWLHFEVELAEAQADVGIIPRAAADAIANTAVPDNIDINALRLGTDKVGRPIDPIVQQIRKVGNNEVKDYLHFGTTTQDVMDTATVMQIRDALDITHDDLKKLILVLADVAEKYKGTPMVARSNGQDALPTTFGMLVASYMTELQRDNVRLQAARQRVLVGQFGSAVGTLSSVGPDGLKVRAALMKRLDLNEPDLSWNASRDNYAEVVQTLALINGCLGRMATDINLWSRTADNSVNEGAGGASSTMPQKRNPRDAEYIGGLAAMSRVQASGALEMLEQSETRQGAPWISEWSTIPQMFLITSGALAHANHLFDHIIVHPDTMLDRFNDSQQYVMAEALQTYLAPKIGLGPAHAMIKDAIKAAPKGTPFKNVILNNAKLHELVGDEKALDTILDPHNYLGLAPTLVENAIQKTRAAVQ